MPAIQQCEVPVGSFLRAYQGGAGYADCYVTEIAGAVSQAAFVEAFYTSGLFKLERTLLKYLASLPATDRDARRLAGGDAQRFSAWQVEHRSSTELLLKDVTGRTRSWLMAMPSPQKTPSSVRTQLFFGSAVVPRPDPGGGSPGMGWGFHALLGFHKLYSRLLLGAASRRVRPA